MIFSTRAGIVTFGKSTIYSIEISTIRREQAPIKQISVPENHEPWPGGKERSSCILSPFEKRLYCAKKRITKGCLYIPFLHRRCPYLVWNKEDEIEEAKRGAKKIVAWSGFTESAIQYAERFRPSLRLVHRDETVKPRRRKPRVATITV